MIDEPRAGRVRVTNPLTTASTHARRSIAQEIDESTGLGEVYMRSLIRLQLRAALAVTATLVLSIGALPIVFWTFDAVTDFTLLGVPLPWWILGLGVYPALFGLGWLYIRQVERAERDFTRLVDPDEHP